MAKLETSFLCHRIRSHHHHCHTVSRFPVRHVTLVCLLVLHNMHPPFLSRPPRVALSSVTFSSGAGAGPIPVQAPLHHPARAAPCLAQYVSIIFHSGLIVYHPNGLICTRPPTLNYCIVTDFVPHAAIIFRCVPRWVGECGCFD